MTQPVISIIVPAHNEAATIAPTLRSLLLQDYPDFEIIVACNGCVDDTAAVSRKLGGGDPRLQVIETERAGMSFGKNFGAAAARGTLLVFVDADTTILPDALRRIVRVIGDRPSVIGTLPGRPDRGGPVVRVCFWIANCITRRNRLHAPGGVMFMQRTVYDEINGFAEDLPQGTSSDLIMRAREKGAVYLCPGSIKGTTSIRRFEKTGIISQMLSWRRNHQNLAAGRHEAVRDKQYENIR